MSAVIDLAEPLPRSVLALGGELKNTVCCARGTTAWISDPLADLEDADTFDQYLRLVAEWPGEHDVAPERLAYDLHPEYLSSKAALRADVWPGVPRVGVQHHEAHVASCAAAEGVWTTCLGLAFDGTGYGTDGTLWGGEFFVGSIIEGFFRVGRFRPVTLAGGTAAIRDPWRIAAALASAADVEFTRPVDVEIEVWEIVRHMLDTENAGRVSSSSVGRLFDGVSALLGICAHADQEAEAAIALEKAAGVAAGDKVYPLPSEQTDNGLWEMDWRPMIRAIVGDKLSGTNVGTLAARFHDSLAHGVLELGEKLMGEGCSTVVASGGVFWNARLRDRLKQLFELKGRAFVTPTEMPPSDAGLSLGQAVLGSFERDCKLKTEN